MQHASEACSVTSSRDVLIVVLDKVPSVEDLDVIIAQGEALHAQLGQDIGVLFVVTSHVSGRPNEGLRQRLGHLRQTANVCCVATVIESRGFVAAIVRGLIQALRVLPAKYPGKTFRTIDEATLWMGKYVSADRAVLRRFVEELKVDRAPSQSHLAM